MNDSKCKLHCFKLQTIFRFLFMFFLFVSTNSCFSKINVSFNIKAKPTKEENVIMKNLKKAIKPKKIIVRQESDGFRYFLLATKDGQMGIYNTSGKSIMPLQMKTIYYFPKASKGYSYVHCSNAEGETRLYQLYHDETEASFVGQDIYNDCMIVNLDGAIKVKEKSLHLCTLPGYIILGTTPTDIVKYFTTLDLSYKKIEITGITINGSRFSKINLYSVNGKHIVEDACNIKFSSKKDANKDILYYNKYIDDVEKQGGLLLDDIENHVPCNFSDVLYNTYNNSWSIKRAKNSDYETYNKDVDYNKFFRDKGEELFEKENYEGVIQFYAKEGIAAPWAKFFTGISLMQLGVHNSANISLCTDYLNKNLEEYATLSFDLPLAKKQLEMSIKVLKSYIEEDSLYKKKAIEAISSNNYYLSELPKEELAYQKALKDLKERKEQAKLAKIQREREIQLRKNEQSTQLMMAILGGFAKALTSGGNSGQPTYRNTGTVSSNSMHSGSSSSNNDKYRQDWLQRKQNAEQELKYYQEQLKKDPNNAAIKHNIRKQQEIIRNAESML